MKRKKNIKHWYLAILMLFLISQVKAQDVENDFQTRTKFELSYKPIKKLKLSIAPQLRFDKNYSLDKSLIDSEVSYKFVSFLSLSAGYRFMANYRDTKDTEFLHRYALSATVKKEFNQFESAFRLRYSNYADDDVEDKDYLKYKLSLNYNIRNCKLTPFVSAEAFHQLSNSSLYKMRYGLGIDYKLSKRNYLGISYMLDYYNTAYQNRHILSVGYKIKL